METGPRDPVRRDRRESALEHSFSLVVDSVMVLIAVSGTPGTGKSTLADSLSRRGWSVIELATFLKERDLPRSWDDERQTFEVDIEELDQAVQEIDSEEPIILVGHLSHLLSVDVTIVLRCRPSVLEMRLGSRGWGRSKVIENLEAEACDVVLLEALDSGVEVCEIDTTSMSPAELVDSVEEILRGEREKYAPGNIDWSEEVLNWF